MVFANGREEYSGQEADVGGPRSLNIMVISSNSDFAWKSGSLSSSSANMQPTDQISTEVVYVVAPRRISGALYDNGCVTAFCCNQRVLTDTTM
jgi:hypothetical protein